MKNQWLEIHYDYAHMYFYVETMNLKHDLKLNILNNGMA
jgi:hypothetical protein